MKLFYLPIAFTFSVAMGFAGYKPLAHSNHEFSFALYHMIQRDENFVISPFSIQNTLYMLYMGGQGLTEYEMKKALFLPFTQNKLPDLYRKSYQALFQPYKFKNKKSLYLASGIWVDKKMPPSPTYRFLIEKNFYGSCETINFQENISTQINDWISSRTNKTIPDLIHKEGISPAAKMILTSAMYLKSPWKDPFLKEQTYLEKFYVNEEGSYSHIPMMHQVQKYEFFENASFRAVFIPLSENQIPSSVALSCILPKNFSFNFTLTDFYEALKGKKEEELEIAVPQMKLTFERSIKKELMSMGMIKPFSNLANFSPITGRDELFISDVFHGCSFSLTEEGIETNTSGTQNTHLAKATLKKSFYLNRPFTFMIYDMDQNFILFIGKVYFPKSDT